MADNPTEQIWQKLWFSRRPNEGDHIRFELGGEEFDNGEHPIPRFLQAFNRAATVADHIFTDDLIGVVAWYPRDVASHSQTPETESGFEGLEKTGFSVTQLSKWKTDVYPDPEEEQALWEVRSYDLSSSKSNRDCLIWHSVAIEMPIYPSAGVLTWLIDPKAALMLHVYDDRGMDLIAKDPKHLKSIYDRFNPWLLDYDRDRMSKLF